MLNVPFAIKASYQTKHFNAGVPQNPGTVFDALHSPPESGVDAVEASAAWAREIGIIAPDPQAMILVKANRDFMRDFYDSASVLREPAES